MKNWYSGALATCVFELRRSFTIQRTAVSVVLALFPPLMYSLLMGAMRVAQNVVEGRDRMEVQDAVANVESFSLFIIVFLVSLVCLLSLLLWATPNVYSELEGKSWTFIASRPGGRVAIFLGKYPASVGVSFGISVVSMSLCVGIAYQLISIPEPERLWLSLFAIYLLACLVYGAIFSMIGTIVYKKAMVVGAGYMIGSEIFVGSIPAIINKLTMRYHLQELGVRWMGFFLPFEDGAEGYRMLYGPAYSSAFHVLCLLGATLLMLGIGIYVIVNRQYISGDET